MTKVRRPRRWHRAAVPFLVLVLLYLLTGVAHTVEEPNLDNAGTLSPTGTGRDGSSRLADLLTARGVTIHRVTSSAEAVQLLDAANGQATPRPMTVFLPAPGFVDPRFFGQLGDQPAGHRVVVVRPGNVIAFGLGFYPARSRWAAKTVPPGCAADLAVSAGPATVLRSRFETEPGDLLFDCYQGGLVGIRTDRTEVVAVGATDPFRNGRIGEAGNAALAAALLGRDRELIWIDLHRTEPRPTQPVDLDLPEYQQPDRASGGTDPTWDAFPPVLWASLILLAGLALLIALVQGRRLGPPVAEPLPVVVPATETVTGRGRLYQRIRSRPETLAALRRAALRRVTPRLDPIRAVIDDDETVTLISARSGLPTEEVRAILHPPPPETDDELAYAVARLDGLVAAVSRVASSPPTPAPHPVDPGGTP